ncbi:cupin domain-containing protein [Sphingobacterium wenxiniae]|uniref:Cupin domain-containing protein n=1 Tax=Sphingobacterium wenxiniae TaxID=683125 RepID=A0A1I6PWP7_9SPHI|nr:cupin domain-containing protein [Sphingobacterium wenxiniae]SFS44609.1 Cupin domain-containing protein [Sphingobacterium wenxiniae]
MKKSIITGLAILSQYLLQAQEVKKFTLADLPSKNVNSLLTRGSIFGEQGNIGYFTYKKGPVVPTHQHSNEQYSIIIKGSVEVQINNDKYIVKAGDGIIIPPNGGCKVNCVK